MAKLRVLKGPNEGADILLEAEQVVLGRDALECGIVIPNNAVSRKHAQITRLQNTYYVEDLHSRNRTYVNSVEIASRVALKHNDKIRICDFVATFLDATSEPGRNPDTDELEEREDSSTVEAMLTPSSHMLLETQPAEKLRGLLEISNSLSRTLELDPLLPKIADSLFNLFRQADRCFLIQTEEGTNRLLPRVVRTRRPQDETTARFSSRIVRRCLETAQAFLTNDAPKDDRIQMSQSVVDFRIRSVMCVPLCRADSTAFGVIQLDTQDLGKKFTQEDLKLLWGVANQASFALENARLHEDAVQQERLRRDLELAHQVQLSFLPRKLPEVASYDFYAHYESALEVGGDYYDFIPLPGGRFAVTLGDVAGKGMPAALLMAKLSSDARFCLLTEPDLDRAVGRLNDLVCEFTSRMDRFVSLVAAVLDPALHTVTLVNAGHPSPLLYRQQGETFDPVASEETSGYLLGITEGYRYDSRVVSLQPGDSLLLFTDGVPEALDTKGTQFTTRGIQGTVRGAGTLTPRELASRVMNAVRQHAAGRDPHDDVTLVCLGRTV
jgi:serine phosphatase RsbU (regulator of sigma subunit)/pSer/pThr/pTyr-binding forkhead associated (FHA) protein